ncbi:MAG: alpha-2-macroglobulin, partial [Winogradskyella sp.]|nr:alpha-2-macroglobulin [Winogradskyella sp.]
ALPVLSNRMLVTETLPMWVRSNQSKTFVFEKLKDNTSITLRNHKLTLEMTSNPAWYAVQALPYLMEYPYDCNEQTFARYYSNTLAQHIVQSNPKIEAVFNQWKSQDVLMSNLEKNNELKSILIQETPWLRDAQSETEQKKRIALLFDLNRMNNELQLSLRKLSLNQLSSGAWPWFNGGRANRYITQHIISGFGHLKQLGVNVNDNESSNMINKAIRYLDAEFIKEYNQIKKHNPKADLSKDHLSYMQLHYLYVRSFYPEVKTSTEVDSLITYYTDQISKYWLSRSLYSKGLMALSMHRYNKTSTAKAILRALQENSITSEELGMYWKANTASWHWYKAPIETQALLIEAFSEIEDNIETVDNLKVWLLKNKQTNRWQTTKATTEAVYALLLKGSDWLSITEAVDVNVGDITVTPNDLENVKVEAGTGYFKTSWTGEAITSDMANVNINKKNKGIAWGAMYWQYFEDLDKITSADTPLQLKKKLFLKSNTDTGEQISEIKSSTQLKVGDLIRVRIELRSDRAMEFLHLKDMRASGLEPINVLSRYKWQDGLGYYESTKDAATNFFIDYLPKGVYVFEYDLRVNNAGNMSNGITTIQSMYAPEFSSHSEGIRIEVK